MGEGFGCWEGVEEGGWGRAGGWVCDEGVAGGEEARMGLDLSFVDNLIRMFLFRASVRIAELAESGEEGGGGFDSAPFKSVCASAESRAAAMLLVVELSDPFMGRSTAAWPLSECKPWGNASLSSLGQWLKYPFAPADLMTPNPCPWPAQSPSTPSLHASASASSVTPGRLAP